MPIVQFINARIPFNIFKIILSPIIGLTVMTVIVFIIKFIVKKIGCVKLLKYIGIK